VVFIITYLSEYFPGFLQFNINHASHHHCFTCDRPLGKLCSSYEYDACFSLNESMDVPCFYYLQEHLEDKNLRQILLESETSAYYAQFDADSSSRKGGTSTK
jgi:hypothetical protein